MDKNIMVVMFLIAFLLLILISAVSNAVNLLKETVRLMENSLNLLNDKPVSLTEKCENSTFIIRLISGLVEDEVSFLFNEYYVLNKKYEMIRLDEDISMIAKKVFESFDPAIFNNKEILLTDAYLMKLISEECYISMMRHAIEHNKKVYSTNT